MGSIFISALRNALRVKYGLLTHAAQELDMTTQKLDGRLRNDAEPLKPDMARQLARYTTQELNKAIHEHADSIRELQRIGRELREAYEEEYKTNKEEQHEQA